VACDAVGALSSIDCMALRLITILAVVGLLACVTPTGGCACSPPTFQIHFVGFVTNDGGPVLGSSVTASVLDTDCQSRAGALSYLAPNGSLVDSTGHYRFELQTWRPDTLCARLVARSASDSSVRDNVLVSIPPTDTVRVDFTLP